MGLKVIKAHVGRASLLVAALFGGSSLHAQGQPHWHPGTFNSALQIARGRETMAALYFHAAGNEACVPMETTLAEAGDVLRALVCMRVDTGETPSATLLERFHVTTLPTMVFLTPDGELEDAIVGYSPPERFAAEVARIRRGDRTLSAHRRNLRDTPDNLHRRLELALKLQYLGDLETYREHVNIIALSDPEGTTLAGARVMLWRLMKEIRESAPNPNQSASYDLTPLREFLGSVHHTAIQLEGWEWIAAVESLRGDRAEARVALRAAWPNVPSEDRIGWAQQTAERFYVMRMELDEQDRLFAVELARTAYHLARVDAPESPESRRYLADLQVTLARCHFANGDMQAAKLACDHARRLDPDSVEARALAEELARG